MNQQFFELPQEKQMRIINAAMEIFSKNEYKRASTDVIAAKAEISKGLLFYYFHNKKELYFYVFSYVEKIVKKYAINNDFDKITDFYELISYAAEKKVELMLKTPYLMDFAMRCFYAKEDSTSEDMNSKMEREIQGIYAQYFKNIDASKFQEHIQPVNILKMIIWMTDGYVHEKEMAGQKMNLEELMTLLEGWISILKKATYKEEYQ